MSLNKDIQDDIIHMTEMEYDGLELDNYDTIEMKSIIKSQIKEILTLKAQLALITSERDMIEKYADKQKAYIERIHCCDSEDLIKIQSKKQLKNIFDEFMNTN